MDSVPFIFIADVVALLHGSNPFLYVKGLQELASPCWANEATRNEERKWLYSISIAYPTLPYLPDYQVLLFRQKTTDMTHEYIRINDFNTFDVGKNVVWSCVWISSCLRTFQNEEHISNTSSYDSLAKCLRRILTGRDCVLLRGEFRDCGREQPDWSLLAHLPRTFQLLEFSSLHRKAEEFIMDSNKLQKLSQLDLKGARVSKEFEEFLHKIVLSAQIPTIHINIASVQGYDFDVFENIIQRWVKNPLGFNSYGALTVYVPVKFDRREFEVHLKQVTAGEGNGWFYYCRGHPLKTSATAEPTPNGTAFNLGQKRLV
uniref:FBA_2 domain-containing protein n=1 Tax=Steinernema glaseri TaxID=37863 RepID=A0A1I8AD59_9BILA